MNRHRKERRQGFTLVELLVVIAIIGLMAGILVPGLSGAFRAAEKRRALGQMKDLEGALKAYFREYGEFPAGWSDKDLAFGANNAEIVGPLLNDGKIPGKNRKGIAFLELESGARTSYDSEGKYLDPWGKPYEILLDLNFDDKIDKVGSAQEKVLKAKVAVESGGPDGQWGTKDDLKTW